MSISGNKTTFVNKIYNRVTVKKIAEISVKNYRAIKQADIELNGITVVSGVNGCGKSTISKLLYYMYRNANNYEDIIIEYIRGNLRPYLDVIEQIQSVMRYGRNIRFRPVPYQSLTFKSLDSHEDYMAYIRNLVSRYIELESNSSDDGINIRLEYILRNSLNIKGENIAAQLKQLVTSISDIIMKGINMNIGRPFDLYKASLISEFDAAISRETTLKEYGSVIYGEGIKNVPLPHYIKKVAYIDTPMIIGMPSFFRQPSHWAELNKLLRELPKRGYKRSINDIIKKEIIKGDISNSDDIIGSGFRYKTDDGTEIDLTECATGIKSFAVLQLLLKNRFLDDSTLLIIDEPEAHLHPQWIIEYARIMVLLHKKLGVKFFLASHSTDMVSAIRYLSEKEKCLTSVNFYIAEKEKGNAGKYKYIALEHDIEPIFASFNKSYEKLDNYAG